MDSTLGRGHNALRGESGPDIGAPCSIAVLSTGNVIDPILRYGLKVVTRIQDRLWDFELAWRERPAGEPGEAQRIGLADARAVLRRFFGDPLAVVALRGVTARRVGPSTVSTWTDEEVLEHLVGQLVAGSLELVRTARPMPSFPPATSAPLPEEVESGASRRRQVERSRRSAPAAESVEHSIAFQVIDDDTEEPLSGVSLRLKLPDGSVATYTTNAQGRVHVADLDPGACDLEAVDGEDAVEVVGLA